MRRRPARPRLAAASPLAANPLAANPLAASLLRACLLVPGGLHPRCSSDMLNQTYQRRYVLPEGALEQIPLGVSQEQVLIALGTPSTVATFSGDVFYYISQQT